MDPKRARSSEGVVYALRPASYALHSKKTAFEKAGVQEYLVVAVRQARVFRFGLRDGVFVRSAAGADGILRSDVFPGLWLAADALLRLDGRRLLDVGRRGTASPEHAAFIR